MKKSFLLMVLILILVNFSSAIKVGVYLEPREEDPKSYCLSVNSESNGYQVLSKLDEARFNQINNQQILCSIDSDTSFVCDPSSTRSFRTILKTTDQWSTNPIPSYDSGEECAREDFNFLTNFIHYSFTTHTFSNAHYCARNGDVLGVINEPKPEGQPGQPQFSNAPSFKEICEPLQIDEIKVYSDEKKLRKPSSTRIKEVEAGKILNLDLNIKNIALGFSNEIKDIEISGTLNLDGQDVGDSKDLSDLESGDDDSVTLSFDIPPDIESDDYKLEIEIKGEDDSNNKFSSKFKYDVEIEESKSFTYPSNESYELNELSNENNAKNVYVQNKVIRPQALSPQKSSSTLLKTSLNILLISLILVVIITAVILAFRRPRFE